MSTTHFLAGLPGFGTLGEDALGQLAVGLESRRYAPGEYLLRRGEPGDHMHVIRAGQVRVPLVDSAGREKAVFLLGEGDLVGEMALLTGEARAADVIAEQETTTVVFHRATLEPLLAAHPPLAAFLRRVRYKLEVSRPDTAQFTDIFRGECQKKSVPFDPAMVDYLVKRHYLPAGRLFNACEPRDLLGQVVDLCAYRGIPPALTEEVLDRVVANYFVKFS